MPSPEPTPTDPRPDQASTGGETPDQGANRNQNARGNPETGTAPNSTPPESTQQDMGDGAGIRGDYGNTDQTNGLEGGPDAPQTDTELTGS